MPKKVNKVKVYVCCSKSEDDYYDIVQMVDAVFYTRRKAEKWEAKRIKDAEKLEDLVETKIYEREIQ